jgi:uncharacterized protein (UPF0128 family)
VDLLKSLSKHDRLYLRRLEEDNLRGMLHFVHNVGVKLEFRSDNTCVGMPIYYMEAVKLASQGKNNVALQLDFLHPLDSL